MQIGTEATNKTEMQMINGTDNEDFNYLLCKSNMSYTQDFDE